jgi:hypothetical protein
MNRGWIVGGALVLVAAQAVPAAAAGVTMVLDRVDDSAGLRKWVSAGDVLRYRVRFEGTARDARLAVATTPVHALTGLTCTSPSQMERPTDPQASTTAEPLASQGVDAEGEGRPASSSELGEDASPEGITGGSSDGVSAAGALAARTLADMETSGSSTAVVPGAQACALGDLSGRRALDVVLTVPEGTGEVALAAVARLRQGAGLTTMTEATGVPVRATGPDGAAAASGDAVDSKTRTSKSRSVRRHDVKAVRTTRRQHQEPGMTEAPRQPEAREVSEATRQPEAREVHEAPRQSEAREADEAPRQSEARDLAKAPQRPGAPRRTEVVQQSANPAKPEVSTKQVEPGDAGIVRQSGKPGKDEAGKRKKAEGVRPGGQVGGSEGLRRVAEEVRRGSEGMGLAGDLWREPVLGGAAEGKREKAELPSAVVPTASAAPSVTGVSMDVPGAPLPRAVAAPQVRLQAAEVVNPLAGGRGLSAAAGGIAVLMAGLWAISRTHRARTRRKVL